MRCAARKGIFQCTLPHGHSARHPLAMKIDGVPVPAHRASNGWIFHDEDEIHISVASLIGGLMSRDRAVAVGAALMRNAAFMARVSI